MKENYVGILKIFFRFDLIFSGPVYESRVRVKHIKTVSNVRKRIGHFSGCDYRVVSFE